MKSIITGILLFTLPLVSFSQDIEGAINKNFTLSGIIKDSQSGETLPFATVFVKGSNFGATTNADGYFTLHKVPTDTSTISISYIGYDKKEIKL